MSAPPDTAGAGLRSPAAQALCVLLLVAAGTGLRLRGLAEAALFIDEGESAVNALSILESGAPRDRFLGLPLYENTLLQPWPESAEYEFKDLSYSSRGTASYHGWLPLYAIAGSLWLHGVRPDDLVPDPAELEREVERRIRAARLPSVAFAAVFVVGLFLAGRALYGVDAGLVAAAVGAFWPKCVWVAQQARYHSAALAFTALALWGAWRAVRSGRRVDYAIAGLLAAVLFHTSSLSLTLLALACVPLVPAALAGRGAPVRVAILAGTFALATVPWIVWSGFGETVSLVPAAREMLAFPEDYLAYARMRLPRVLAGAAAVALLCAAWALRRRLPERLAAPAAAATPPALFCAWWIAAAYAGFHLLTPAPSLWMERLSYSVLPGLLLLGAVMVAAAARVAAPGAPAAVALGGTLALLLASGNALHRQRRDLAEAEAVVEVARYALERVPRDARIYALPSQHLSLCFLTGLPVQSVLPVRRAFLDAHPGEIAILETAHRPPRPPRAWLQEILARRGIELSAEERDRWHDALYARLAHDRLAPRVREVAPIPPLPPEAAPVKAELERRLAESRYGEHPFDRDNPAMLGDYPPMTIADFWPVFFYRFVKPEERSGERSNYAGRARQARAEILRSGWAVLRCPALGDPVSEVVR